jgi:low temperature requirement protein LtrA
MKSVESFKERHTTWLENFYDLVVAIIVYQLSRDLYQDVSVNGFLIFVALFIPVIWSWIGVTFYSTRFETDDLVHRLLMLLQVAAAAFMAVSVPDGLGKNSVWFALSYVVIRTILVIEYLRTGTQVPAAHQLTKRYSIGFSISAGIWFVSVFVPPPARFILWIVGLVIDVCTPLLYARRFSVQFAPHRQHLPERFGSFTIIVLGISILGVVNGIAPHNWTVFSIISAGLGLGIAFSFWWVYFDTVDGSEIKALRENHQIGAYITWLYIHFPLIIGFTAFGVSIEHLVLGSQFFGLPSEDKWLLCVSTFFCLFALGIIQLTSTMTSPAVLYSKSNRTIKYIPAIYSLVGSGIVLVLGDILSGINVLPVFVISIMASVCIGQVILDVKRHPHHRFLKF